MGYWVYLAKCGNNTIYTGATTDLLRREREHNRESGAKSGAKYTASRRPVSLVQAWEVGSWSDALRLESALKKCPRAVKDQLIVQGALIDKVARQRNLAFAIAQISEDTLGSLASKSRYLDL